MKFPCCQGIFQVVHQSPTMVQLCAPMAVPLFCIASNHCIEYKYWWHVSGRGAIGTISTPVIWVNEEGMYHCRVVHHATHKECTSQIISVKANVSGIIISCVIAVAIIPSDTIAITIGLSEVEKLDVKSVSFHAGSRCSKPESVQNEGCSVVQSNQIAMVAGMS